MKDIVIIANFCRDFSETDNGRFMYLCKALSKDNNVEIITSDYNHALKKHKDKKNFEWPFKITFIHEPGYKKNISIKRFYSHFIWGQRVNKYIKSRVVPDVIYCAIPSLSAAYYSAKFCEKNNVRFAVDIQDLWPEAFRMVFNVPFLSSLIFKPFSRKADSIYKRADLICGVSNQYVERALSVNSKCKFGNVVYLGTDLNTFDNNVKTVEPILKKDNKKDIWIGYCGSLERSYDIPCVLSALEILNDNNDECPRLILMGDGSKKADYESLANIKGVNATFLGKLSYDKMCSQLKQCDIVVNPIIKGSAASIINKHGDYAASGLPVINTQDNDEYRRLVEQYEMGFNCENGNSKDLAEKIKILINDDLLRITMGHNARRCAEERFDRKISYKELINEITK